MKWYTLLVYLRPDDPDEDLYKAHSKEEAFAKARGYWGPEPIIEFKE